MLAAGGKVLKKLEKVSRLWNSNSELGVYDICRREKEGEREREREREREDRKQSQGGREK